MTKYKLIEGEYHYDTIEAETIEDALQVAIDAVHVGDYDEEIRPVRVTVIARAVDDKHGLDERKAIVTIED